MPPIYITGAGVVSAIGIGQAATLEALKTGTTGIAPMRYLDSRHSELPVGEVKHSNSELAALLGASDDIRLTRTALLGRLALSEALLQAGLITPENISRTSYLVPRNPLLTPLSSLLYLTSPLSLPLQLEGWTAVKLSMPQRATPTASMPSLPPIIVAIAQP